MNFNRNFLYIFIITLLQMPMHSVFAYTTDRSLASYFTNNILLRLLIYGGYYSLGITLTVTLLAVFFKSFRVYVISFCMALIAIYLLILIREAVEDLSLLQE